MEGYRPHADTLARCFHVFHKSHTCPGRGLVRSCRSCAVKQGHLTEQLTLFYKLLRIHCTRLLTADRSRNTGSSLASPGHGCVDPETSKRQCRFQGQDKLQVSTAGRCLRSERMDSCQPRFQSSISGAEARWSHGKSDQLHSAIVSI